MTQESDFAVKADLAVREGRLAKKKARALRKEALAEVQQALKTPSLSWAGRLKMWVLPPLIRITFRLLKCTWRLEEGILPPSVLERQRSGKAIVCAHWHEDEWALLGFYMHRQMIVMVSHSEDGALMARMLSKLGFDIVRGSSSRGAASGLLQLIRAVKKSAHKWVSLAVDGPRGPRHRAKKGIFKLSESFGADILPGVAVADRAWVFQKSWSKAYIPKPFARVYLQYGEPLQSETVSKALERDDFAELCYELEARLKNAKVMAQECLRGPAKNH